MGKSGSTGFSCVIRAACVLLVCGLCAAGNAQPVEVVDWLGVAGISMDSSGQFEVVRSATLPMSGQVNRSFFPTSLTPGGSIIASFDLQALPGAIDFTCFWDGVVDTASGDGSTDGPLLAIGLLVRVFQPTAYTVSSSAVMGAGAGQPTNMPQVSSVIAQGFCFAPGSSPQGGQAFCVPTGLPDIQSMVHADNTGFETSLVLCCPSVPDVGQVTGILQPGDYSFWVRSSTDMNVLFGGGGDSYGDVRILLEWTASCAADLNGDGILDTGDIQAFVAFFLAQDLAADLNGDGILDTGDIQAFVSFFLAGC